MKVTVLFTRKDPVNDDTVILDQSVEFDTTEMEDVVVLGSRVQAALIHIQRNWIMDEYGQLTEKPEHSQKCKDAAFIFHAATGGDADCICGRD